MTVQGSPNVAFSEQDLATYVSSSSTTVGAICGDFVWGPTFYPLTISTELDLVNYFGKPSNSNYKDWFVAQNYLNYSGALRVCRICNDSSLNAAEKSADVMLIKNESDFTSKYGTLAGSGKTSKVYARYPGTFGNSLQVIISDKTALETVGNTLKPYVSKTLTADDVAVGVLINGELKEFGMYSFTKGNTDMNGYSNYIISSVNNSSKYIYLIEEKLITYTSEVRNSVDVNVTLSGGSSVDVTTGNYKSGWDLFKNPDTEDVALLLQGGADSEVGAYIIDTIAGQRKDCVACVSPQESDCVNNLDPVSAIKTTCSAYAASSYRFVDGNYKYQYDSYNEVYRWVPLNGDTAGLMALTDYETKPWFSPAGKTIKNIVKLAFYPDKAARDSLYAANINPITAFKEDGFVLYGDWTGVSNSKFNFIGVRRCFIYMEKAISAYARKVMWQQNDASTQTQFIQSVEPFLRGIQGGRGISDFKIYADSTVNTPDLVDQGIFTAKIAVKPISSIRWVQLTFVSTRSDVTFDEVIQ